MTATNVFFLTAIALLAAMLTLALVAWRRAAQKAMAQPLPAAANPELEARMAELLRAQGEITGHVQSLTQRLDGFGHRVGQSVSDANRATTESLSKLGERLAVIDKAQQTITTLSTQVVELQHVLANKQTRGAFGQARMEAIVRDALPPAAYAFQPTLKNGTRPDCLILFPNGGASLVIDAKFPLEAWNAVRAAGTPEATKAAEAQFRRDTVKHIQDIADRYFVPGETQDTAFMFVPSESIFADIHERFEDVIQRAHRSRIVVVSPSLLMLSVQVVLSLMRDQRMREQAHVIKEEVIRLIEDVNRLDERARRLQMHFGQANKDLEEIFVSTRKVAGRGQRIGAVEFDTPVPAKRPPPATQAARANGPELPFNGAAERAS